METTDHCFAAADQYLYADFGVLELDSLSAELTARLTGISRRPGGDLD
jgi:hypothetical protein